MSILHKQAERQMHEPTAKRPMEELRNNNSSVSQTAYHQAKQIGEAPWGA
jgi:hypothetical protein